MGSSKEYLEFVLEQLSDLKEINAQELAKFEKISCPFCRITNGIYYLSAEVLP